jgi:hypothetical protein
MRNMKKRVKGKEFRALMKKGGLVGATGPN